MPERIKIDISTTTILKTIFIILGLVFLYLIRDIVLLFFIVLIIVAAVGPIIDRVSKYIPRILAVILFSLLVLSLVVLIGYFLIPPLVLEISQLAANMPTILSNLGVIYHNVQQIVPNYQEILLNLSSQLGRVTSGFFASAVSFFTGIVAIFTAVVLVFYILLEQDSIKNFVSQMAPPERREKIFSIAKKIIEKMGQWLRGQVALMIIIGLLDGIALVILGVPYALVLAIWGGLTEIIPYLGPWLGLIPAVALAFTVSPLTALLVLVAYLIIQQLEAQFLAPKVMGKAVGLSPIIIILALLIGGKLFGILGILIAVPVAATIWVLLQEWPAIKSLREKATKE